MIDLERRTSARAELRLPVRLYSKEFHPKPMEIHTYTVDVSSGGVLLNSPRPLRVGSTLAVSLQVPSDISGSAFSQFKRKAIVIHEQSQAGGELCYGLKFEGPMQLRSPIWEAT